MINKYKKQIILLIIIVAIPSVILVMHYFNQGSVKTKRGANGSKLPQIDIESTDVKAVNDYLDQLYKEYTTNSKNKFKYSTYENDELISVLVDINEYNDETKKYTQKYIGFNVDKETNKFIDKEAMAEKYGFSLVDIVNKVDDRLKKFYEEEDELGYLELECDYECYLSYMRNIDNILDSIELVVEKGKLVVYINLTIDSYVGDDEYFESLDYNPYKIILE